MHQSAHVPVLPCGRPLVHSLPRSRAPALIRSVADLLTIILVLSFAISISVHGAETLSVNPLGGMGWSGLQKSGACWPADLHDGHVYLPLTALIVYPS